MKKLRLSLSVLLSVTVLGFAFWQNSGVSGAAQKLKIESAKVLHTAQRGGTRIKFLDGETVETEYSANAELLADLQNSVPKVLATGDFDRDGVPDLLSGYESGNGGLLTLHRGNEASIFPAGRDARGEKIAPFLADASVIKIDETPDFIGVGDFNNDSLLDVVTAKRGGANLNYFKGNGRGAFAEVEKIAVDGSISTMTAGNLNRDDGTPDLAVAVETDAGAKVLIYEGWQGALNNPKIETIDLPTAATILQTVSFDADAFGDLAIAAGNELILVRGRDRKLTRGENVEVPEAVINRNAFESKILSLTAGRFTENATEIAVLTENGALHSAKMTGAQASPLAMSAKREKAFEVKSSLLFAEAFTPQNTRRMQAGTLALQSARVSASLSTDDLILLDGNQIKIFGKEAENLEILAAFDGENEMAAVLPMRLNKDGLDDLVFLQKNQTVPAVAMTAPQAVFTVNSTGLDFDINPGNGVCETAAGNGECTFQAAIGETNSLAGADEIRFNLPGSAPFSIAVDFQFLRTLTQTVTLDATTQPGFSGSPIVELNGTAATLNPRALEFSSSATNSVVRGFVINRFVGDGIVLASASSGVFVEGNYIGTNIAGTAASPNGTAANIDSGGGVDSNGTSHTIGGTTAAARNVISGNNHNGIRLGEVSSVSGTAIRGNFIGTDKNGTADLGNAGDGIRSGNIGGANVTIGGTAAGAGNVISGNGRSGVQFTSSTGIFLNLVIEGNFIGTDLNGNVDLGNDNRGVLLNGYKNARIGGTSNASRNIISGNGKDGIELNFSQGVNVQGNFIGVKLDGTTALTNDRHGVFLTNQTESTTIGGGTPVIGQCNAPCNTVFAGENGKGVSMRSDNPPNLSENQLGGSPQNQFNLLLNILLKKQLNAALEAIANDLNDDGRTPNDLGDADTGINGLQNFPDLSACSNNFNIVSGTNSQCTGNLNSNPNTAFTIDMYLNTLNGQNVTSSYLGSHSLTTDSQGNAPFTFSFTIEIPNNSSVTAITRRSNGDTSEDSPPRQIGGTPCTYQVTPTSFTVGAEVQNGNSVTIQTQAGCVWTAVSNNGFLTNVNPPNGTGNGAVTFNIAGNTGPAPRVGTLTIAGQTVTVNQFGCTYNFNPGTLRFSWLAFLPERAQSATLQTQTQCQWQLSISDSFVTANQTQGTGGANITFLATNNQGGLRTSTVSVVGTSASLLIRQNSANFPNDYEGDNKSDIAVYGSSGSLTENLFSEVNAVPNAIGSWRVTNSSNGNQTSTPFGLTDDKLVPGDYNGDGRSDFAVFRPSDQTWYIARPTGVPAQNFDAIPFGAATDIPVPNDYDGDGLTDIAVFRPSTGEWWIRRSSDNNVTVQRWGLSGDKPVPGNYDNDGLADIAVWRPSDRIWYILKSSNGTPSFLQFGLSSDKPVPGDYDGDFLNDIAVFRPSTGEWFILRSSDNGLQGANWGLATDKLTPADFDGDLKTDIAVWRPSTQTWFILRSTNGVPQITQQGQSGDVPVVSALIPD